MKLFSAHRGGVNEKETCGFAMDNQRAIRMSKQSALMMCILVALGGMLVSSCSDTKTTTPVQTESAIHPDGWNNAASPDFHGTYLEKNNWNTQECVRCHGQSFGGGVSGVACSTCHGEVYPHPNGWEEPQSPSFHGTYLKGKQFNATECKSCHGEDFKGGSSGKSCYSCHASYPHSIPDWVTPSSPNSHGRYLKAKQWTDTECTACHGTDYAGGSVGVACFTCHDSYPHSARFQPYHTGYLRSKLYPLPQCQTCHGQTYAGGTVVDVSCMQSGCHVDGSGTAKPPEACNTCHGTFSAPASNFLSAAPPAAVAGQTATTYPGVGAHQTHLVTGTEARPVKCTECHSVPASYSSPGHITPGLRATVAFNDTLASLKTNNGAVVPTPAYDQGTNKCSNVYCHGYFKNGNLANTPTWTKVDGTQAACGTCHGDAATGNPLPGGTHLQGSSFYQCQNCHFVTGAGVTATYDGTKWTIVDSTRHVNGKLSFFGAEQGF
jgi:predicted CxxxxCH...CXXCH cytochrome family protein